MIVMMMMVPDPQTVGDVRAGHKADHAARNEADRAGHEGARSRAERTSVTRSPALGRNRHQQRRGDESDGKHLFHDIPSGDVTAGPCIRGPTRPSAHLIL